MAEIVNLRTARKRKRRAQAEAAASANRVSHGRPRAEADVKLVRDLQDRRLDGHLRVTDGERDPADHET